MNLHKFCDEYFRAMSKVIKFAGTRTRETKREGGFLLYEGVKGDTLERGTSMMTHDKVVLWPRSAESVRTTSLVPRLCPTGLCGFALVISYYTIAAWSALYCSYRVYQKRQFQMQKHRDLVQRIISNR